jgi:hypothetical protein
MGHGIKSDTPAACQNIDYPDRCTVPPFLPAASPHATMDSNLRNTYAMPASNWKQHLGHPDQGVVSLGDKVYSLRHNLSPGYAMSFITTLNRARPAVWHIRLYPIEKIIQEAAMRLCDVCVYCAGLAQTDLLTCKSGARITNTMTCRLRPTICQPSGCRAPLKKGRPARRPS